MASFQQFNFQRKARRPLLWVSAIGSIGAAAYLGLQFFGFNTDVVLEPHRQIWDFEKFGKKYDHKALRRGFQVFREVCSSCHSINFLCFRELVGITHTEAEMKAIAASYDCPNPEQSADGLYGTHPGLLKDHIPGPYPNELAAREANNGAYPPDLSLIALGREGEHNYLFHLLTGYREPPAGAKVPEGQYYNPYFSGQFISMPQPLYDESVEYEDGTPASLSQEAKDVSTFLRWVAVRDHNERQYELIKGTVILSLMIWGVHPAVRRRFNVLKNQNWRYTGTPAYSVNPKLPKVKYYEGNPSNAFGQTLSMYVKPNKPY